MKVQPWQKALEEASQYFGWYRKFVAASLFYSGQLAASAEQSFAKSNQCWQIVRYQQIVDPDSLLFPPPQKRFVRPDSFAKHVVYLAKKCKVIPLIDLLEALENDKPIEPFTVALTFDCGWNDFYFNAWPILQRYNLPATMFLPTSFIGTKNTFWQDKILACVLMYEHHLQKPIPLDFLPDRLQGEMRDMQNEHGSLVRCAYLIAELELDPELRGAALIYLGTLIDNLGGLPEQDMFLTWDQVRELQQAGVEFGTMGHTYRFFDEITREEIAEELASSARVFSEQQVKTIPALAYPSGTIPKGTRSLLKDLGLTHTLADSWKQYPPQKDGVYVHPRLPMLQAAAPSTDVFACRLWKLSSLGVSF